MQWLLNILYEKCESYIDAYLAAHPPLGGYVDRGDFAGWDFTTNDFAKDWSWHEIDLSAIVPANAVAVVFTCNIETEVCSKQFQLRKSGSTGVTNRSANITAAAGRANEHDMFCACSNDRKVEYRADPTVWTSLLLSVRGWYLSHDELLIFVNRGDPALVDYAANDLIHDGEWYDLDLSSIIPSNTNLVFMNVRVRSSSGNVNLRFRTKGNQNIANVSNCIAFTPNSYYAFDVQVPTAGLTSIEYCSRLYTSPTVEITVKGWSF